MARRAASAMRFMRSLPINARLFFQTLRTNNLPETGKRQYENKADAGASRRNGVDRRTTQKESICTIIFTVERNAVRCGATSANDLKRLNWRGSERIAKAPLKEFQTREVAVCRRNRATAPLAPKAR